jgi:hypothetical protein
MSILERMSRASRGTVAPAGEIPGSLEVIVLHTTTKETLEALRAAAGLADGLAARIRLLVLETVPYPLPVNQPQVAVEFTKHRFRTVAAHARIETHVDLRLGRDYRGMLESALKPRSLIVVGGRRGWWPGFHHRLAERLERQGHHVVFSAAK